MIFQYAQLLKGSIRLARFHPNSTPSSISLTVEHQERYTEKHVHFTALAYELQEPGGEMKEITLQGRTKLVPRTLWQALSTLVEHRDTSRRFWIDYVCVNQRDDAEKMAHKSQLSSIYASADEVLLWMGSIDSIAGAEREKIVTYYSLSLSEKPSPASPQDYANIQSALERLQLQHAIKVTPFGGNNEGRQADFLSTL